MSSSGPQDLGIPLLLEEYLTVSPPVTSDSTPLCAACHALASSQRCSMCKEVHYCSSKCQMLDWPLHKLLCRHSTASSRPDPANRRALYLPDDKDKPRFVWLKYGNDGRPFDKAKCFPTTPADDIKTIGFHNRYLSYWIQISYDSNPSGRDLKRNMSIKSVWFGPLVVIVYSAEEGLSKPALDIQVGALRPVVEYLRLRSEYRGLIFVEQPQEQYGEEEWKKLLAQEKK
ncbi:hypothetical protein C7974DRAFT_302274 [Boeremia exigua]|uniref:uncharacterized protein n=1 Tax=Boeremia exigua TaxID=749465 RepID=UPI001E8DC219|nr:uncharacterized protein C7974DRAFT_302274 [Boeremia exigua]KAH6643047.1 hypothetical protein C7974DRAFT_302274 [Boeremia exigua]